MRRGGSGTGLGADRVCGGEGVSPGSGPHRRPRGWGGGSLKGRLGERQRGVEMGTISTEFLPEAAASSEPGKVLGPESQRRNVGWSTYPAFVVDTPTGVVFPCGCAVVERVLSDWMSVSGEVHTDPPGARSWLELALPPRVRKKKLGL